MTPRRLELLSSLATPHTTKILFWVFDGVGGLPHPSSGKTALEAARLPHLDAFASASSCGLHEPCGPGVSVGSGLGHLALFGYPTDDLQVGRGVLEVLGSDEAFEGGARVEVPSLRDEDVAWRCNFARLLGDDGPDALVEDRRANDLTRQRCAQLCEQLSATLRLPDGVRMWLCPGREHRFSMVLRGEGLSPEVTDADPLRSGRAQPAARARAQGAQATADLLNDLIAQARGMLRATSDADTILVRGAGRARAPRSLESLYHLRCGAFAQYPMYKGVARLVGMDVLPDQDAPLAQRLDTLESSMHAYDFCFFHTKEPDALGHKGDFEAKVAFLEHADAQFARVAQMGFDVVVVTGDHCTPAVFGEHSWHPVPTMLWSEHILAGDVQAYTERACVHGTLGRRSAQDLMALALAEARRLNRHGV